jgi:hypothetical protein
MMGRLRWIARIGGAAVTVLGCTSVTGTNATDTTVLDADDCGQLSCPAAAIVTIAWSSRPDTMRVRVEGAQVIQAAEEYVRTGSGPGIVAGRIVRGAGVDPSVPFHYLPDSISLVEVAAELCDSALLRTPAAVDRFFSGATGRADAVSAPYCPWDARPVDIEPAP